MAYIKIKGIREPFLVTNSVAKDFNRLYINKDEPRNTIVTVGNWTGKLESIDSIVLNEEDENVSKPSQQDDHMKIEFEERRKFLSRTLEEKANDISFANLVYTIFTGEKRIPEYLEKEFVDVQRVFFGANPKRTVCDVKEFKTIIGDKAVVGTMTGLIENILRTDMRLSR